MFGNKIYACEDRVMPINCFICVGKENCTNYRIGNLDSEKELNKILEDKEFNNEFKK